MRHATAGGRYCRPLIWWATAVAGALLMLVAVPVLAGLPVKLGRAAAPAAHATVPGISPGSPNGTPRSRAGLVRHADGHRHDKSASQFRASGVTALSAQGGSVGEGWSDAASAPPGGRVQLRYLRPAGSSHLGKDPPPLARRALPPAAPRPPPQPAGDA